VSMAVIANYNFAAVITWIFSIELPASNIIFLT